MCQTPYSVKKSLEILGLHIPFQSSLLCATPGLGHYRVYSFKGTQVCDGGLGFTIKIFSAPNCTVYHYKLLPLHLPQIVVLIYK